MATIGPIRCEDTLRAAVEARGDVSAAVRAALTRWYAYLAAGLREVQGVFSEGEQALLADICNGTSWEPWLPEMLAANVEDCEPEYDSKWGVDRGELLNKLAGLTAQQAAAVIDAVERFWAAVGAGALPDPRRMLDLPDAAGE